MSKKRPRKATGSADREPELFSDLVDRRPERPLPKQPDDDLRIDDDDDFLAPPPPAAKEPAPPAEPSPAAAPEPVAASPAADSAPISPPAPTAAPAPSGDAEEWDLDSRGASAVARKDVAEADDGEPSPKPQEEGDDESATAGRRRREELPSVQRTGNPQLDRIGRIVAMVLVPVLLIGVFWTMLNRRPEGDGWEMRRSPDLPMEGNLTRVIAADSGWRDRAEADRVSSEKDPLTKETVYPKKLPQITLRLEGSKNAFVRILFMSPDRRIAGDPRVVKIVGGKLDTPPTGVKQDGDSFTVTASSGILDAEKLRDYLAGSQPRWSIELSESSDYQAKGDEWKKLGHFAVADKEL